MTQLRAVTQLKAGEGFGYLGRSNRPKPGIGEVAPYKAAVAEFLTESAKKTPPPFLLIGDGVVADLNVVINEPHAGTTHPVRAYVRAQELYIRAQLDASYQELRLRE